MAGVSIMGYVRLKSDATSGRLPNALRHGPGGCPATPVQSMSHGSLVAALTAPAQKASRSFMEWWE
jgi:hypothetical protein